MMNVTVNDLATLTCFWLVLSRVIALMLQLPIWDDINIPVIVKILGTFVFTYAIFPVVQPYVMHDLQQVGSFWMLTIYYTLSGLIIGMMAKLLMQIFVSAGSMITQQIGFAAVRYFDPSAQESVGPFERLLTQSMTVIILLSGAIYPMFKGTLLSFRSFSWTNLAHATPSMEYFLNVFKSLFLSSILLSSPFIFLNLLIMSILGIVAKTVPQLNVLMVSFVINIAVGLLVFTTNIQEFFQVGFKIYSEHLADWFNLMGRV